MIAGYERLRVCLYGKNMFMKCIKKEVLPKAAQNLYISQPSLSARIKKIEEIIGEPLFDRSTTPLQLTEVGKVYIEAAEEITQIEQRVENYINDLAGLKDGESCSRSKYAVCRICGTVSDHPI